MRDEDHGKAQFAAQLLRQAASLFRDLAQSNPDVADQMRLNAQSYEAVADLVERDPNGQMPL